MSRRTMTLTAAVMLAVAGAASAIAPAHAVETTPHRASATPLPSVSPCPLTDAQQASGRRTIADARRTVDRARLDLNLPSGPPPSTAPAPFNLDNAELCVMALADLADKKDKVVQAVERYMACVAASAVTGNSCNGEFGNARAAINDLEAAVTNLQFTCPWLYPF